MEEIANKCIFCGSEAKIVHFDRNMWYVQCSNHECKKHDKFAFLGNTRNNAIEQWNFSNREGSFRKNENKKD